MLTGSNRCYMDCHVAALLASQSIGVAKDCCDGLKVELCVCL